MSTEDLEIEYRINSVLICNVNYYVKHQRICVTVSVHMN